MMKMTVCPIANEDAADNFQPGDGSAFGVILVEDSTGHTTLTNLYREGEHMSWAKQDATEQTPYVSDILQGLVDKYNVGEVYVSAQQCLLGHEKEAYHICEKAFEEQFCSSLVMAGTVLTDGDLADLEKAAGNNISLE